MALQASAPPDAYQFVKYLKTVKSMPRSDLKPADNAKSFIICHRNDSGETDFRYSHDDNVAVCVTYAINICRSMLENQEVRNAFINIAELYSQEYTIAYPEHEGNMGRVTDDFIQKIRGEFPIVFGDDGWEDPRMMGAQFRFPWNGSFKSSNKFILVNGTTLNDTVLTAKKAQRATTDTERKGYQAFRFREEKSLLHEMSHSSITYLSRGGEKTPPIITATVAWDPDPKSGEASCRLESLNFGGTMEYWVDPDHGNCLDKVDNGDWNIIQ